MKLRKTFLLATTIGIISSSCNMQKVTTEQSLAKIPTENEVGALMLPEKIEAVKSPFPMIKFEKPNFRQDTVIPSLLNEGLNTDIIQKSIDSLSEKGGGIVMIPQGKWNTGRIQLKDNINLYFADSAILQFSSEIKDYLPAVFMRHAGIELMSLGACIYANEVNNIAITGNGRLIGPGETIRDQIEHVESEKLFDADTPIEERVYDGIQNPIVFRPMFIAPVNCTKVYIEGISLENTAFWNIVPIYCDNVIIRGITVNSVGIPMGDGIDIESSKNVLIEYCTLACGDDSFTMKSGRGEDGLRVNKSTENVVVRYCLTKEGHGGITCGTETAGMIRNLYVHDCVFLNTLFAIRFKTRRPRGGGGENLYYERLRVSSVKDAFTWDMLGSVNWLGEIAKRLPIRPVNKLTPKYQNIHINDIIVENSRYFIKAQGIPESPLKNVTIKNVNVKCSNIIDMRDVQNSSFSNITITSDKPNIDILDSKDLSFKNISFTNIDNVELNIKGDISDSISFKSCSSIQDQEYLRKNHE